nr:HNH endonuclease [Paenalkalicoccus suaedae]
MKPKKKCSVVSCNVLTSERFCPDHKKEYYRRLDKERGTAHERGYNSRWRKARLFYLRRHPLCKRCADNGQDVPAQVVDHIIPHKGDAKLFWAEVNWQSLCKSCHDTKTAKEDGGFGREAINEPKQ